MNYTMSHYKYRPWKGLDKGDGKYRIYRVLPSCLPATFHAQYSRGVLIQKFTKLKLMRIAWILCVSNPDGFSNLDARMFSMNDLSGFCHFMSGWTTTKKDILIEYIWNHLLDTDSVKKL